MFIGNKEIKVALDQEDGKNVELEFVDETIPKQIINKELFALISTEVEGNGNTTDKIRDYFSRKFVAELAFYGLEYYFVNNIAIGMETLVHNLREELIRMSFNCSGADSIAIELLVPKVDKTE